MPQVENIHTHPKGPAPIRGKPKNYEPVYLVNGWSVSSQISLKGVLHSGIEPFKIKITILINLRGWKDFEKKTVTKF